MVTYSIDTFVGQVHKLLRRQQLPEIRQGHRPGGRSVLNGRLGPGHATIVGWWDDSVTAPRLSADELPFSFLVYSPMQFGLSTHFA